MRSGVVASLSSRRLEKSPAVQSSLGDERAGPNPTAEIHYSLTEEFTKEQYSLIK